MWDTKIFMTSAARNRWINRNSGKYQIVEIFINNAYGVEYKKLRIIG